MSQSWNFSFFTFGGLQLWGDKILYNGWRIQENYWSKRCRLLDPYNIRRARGSYNECLAALEDIKKIWELEKPSGHLVMLIHGLGRTCNSFNAMKKYLKEMEYNTVAISYPSTRLNVKHHAENLEFILDNLEGIDRISFVTHSLGGIIVRALLANDGKWKQNIIVEKLVQIAPPNNGSILATRLEKISFFRSLFGPALKDLCTEDTAAIPSPSCDFGIIAGGMNNEKGFNPFIKGDNDLILKVEETRIQGFSDFFVVSMIHTFLPCFSTVIYATERFLSSGRFSKTRKPKKNIKMNVI